MIKHSSKVPAWLSFAALTFLAGSAMAQPTSAPAPQVQTRKVIVTTDGESTANGSGSSSGTGSGRSVFRIQSIEPDRGKEPAREVTWLGLSTEDASEALTSQLSLKAGQGLVVTFVAPDSPAAKAGIQKYDVLESLGDQTLVDPGQLRKLIQMQTDGDTIKLTLHRGGKKQTVSAALVKRKEGLAMFSGGQAGELAVLTRSGGGNWIFENQKQGQEYQKAASAYSVVNRQMVDTEVQRNMEQARTAIQDALRQSSQATRTARPMAPLPPQMPAFPTMVDVGNNATVTVTQDGASVKTIVKSDDTGVYVLVASPQKHLTAHDQNGKLLFDGDIEILKHPSSKRNFRPNCKKKSSPCSNNSSRRRKNSRSRMHNLKTRQKSETKLATRVLYDCRFKKLNQTL
ncbi:MAG: PDZ domain-containing protein [Limisphaerales bacterium]